VDASALPPNVEPCDPAGSAPEALVAEHGTDGKTAAQSLRQRNRIRHHALA
jgi:hypothetical protein